MYRVSQNPLGQLQPIYKVHMCQCIYGVYTEVEMLDISPYEDTVCLLRHRRSPFWQFGRSVEGKIYLFSLPHDHRIGSNHRRLETDEWRREKNCSIIGKSLSKRQQQRNERRPSMKERKKLKLRTNFSQGFFFMGSSLIVALVIRMTHHISELETT